MVHLYLALALPHVYDTHIRGGGRTVRKGLAASIAKKAGISAAALLAVVVVVGAAALLGGGWYFAGEIENGALVVDWSEPEFDMEVAAIGAGQVPCVSRLRRMRTEIGRAGASGD